MPRMFDFILCGDVRRRGDRLKTFQAAVPVVADNVAQDLWVDCSEPEDDPTCVADQLEWDDYPNVLSPFDNQYRGYYT